MSADGVESCRRLHHFPFRVTIRDCFRRASKTFAAEIRLKTGPSSYWQISLSLSGIRALRTFDSSRILKMASQTQSFVFIDEDQQKKYSKSTLSAINSQVAKYAHAQKQRKPIVKSHSAPTSPPTLGSSPEAVENNTTQDDQLNRRVRRTSQPNAARSKYGSLDALKSGQKDPQKRSSFSIPSKRKSNSQSKSSKDTSAIVVITEAAVDENDAPTTDDKPPEDLSDLFQNLCRITKYPSYQAFPFFLNLEERRLAHYCRGTNMYA